MQEKTCVFFGYAAGSVLPSGADQPGAGDANAAGGPGTPAASLARNRSLAGAWRRAKEAAWEIWQYHLPDIGRFSPDPRPCSAQGIAGAALCRRNWRRRRNWRLVQRQEKHEKSFRPVGKAAFGKNASVLPGQVQIRFDAAQMTICTAQEAQVSRTPYACFERVIETEDAFLLIF